MTQYIFPATRPGNALPLHAKVAATASVVPAHRATNAEIIERHHHRVNERAIEKLVGVRERRVAPHGVADSDLLADAAALCLEKAGLEPEQLSKLIVTRFLGDRLLPPTAALVQKKMNVTTAIQAFDITGGVHSFMEAMETAARSVDSADGPVLVVSGGVINRLVSRTDPRLAFLFGDGAAAVLLTPSDTPRMLASYGFSNRRFINDVTAFRLRTLLSEATYESADYAPLFDLYEMGDWHTQLDFITQAMQVTLQNLLRDAGKSAGDIDLFLITENHDRLCRAVLQRLGIPMDKTLSLLPTLGNTMSAMLPMLLDHAIETRKVGPGATVVLLSVGEGLKGGGLLITL